MLFEDDVIDSVIAYLSDRDYTILYRSYATQHGYIIIALSQNGVELIIEAKGQTSSIKGTNRYGKEFTPSQKFDHVSKAVFKSLQSKTEKDSEIDVPATNCKKINKWYMRSEPNDKEERL